MSFKKKKKRTFIQDVYFLYSFLCYIMSSAYLFYICRKNSHVRNPTVWFINRQYVSAFCRRGCVWNHPSQPEAVEKETLPLCLLLYADHRQRCFTRGFLVLFFFFWKFLCFLWQGKGRKKPPLEQFHGQCCYYKICPCLLLFQRQCERSRETCRLSCFFIPCRLR